MLRRFTGWCLLFWSALVFAVDNDNGDLPLEGERQISFETSEATWLSLDVSPDGATLVIEILGDLYTLPVAGGNAEPLTLDLFN